MIDPLAQVVELLRPRAAVSKLVEARGSWTVRRAEAGRPFYCAVLEGRCRLAVPGEAPLALGPGDFVLVPSAQDFAVSTPDPGDAADGPPPPEGRPVEVEPGRFRIGPADGAASLRMLVGYGAFATTDAALLVSLLPRVAPVRGDPRLAALMGLLDDESRGARPARDAVTARLLEVLLIEALRAAGGPSAEPGLLRGLLDRRLAVALRLMHEDPKAPWTVAGLARAAGLSRSAFFDRFRRAVGASPMAYLLGWRMALAKDLLGRGRRGVGEVAVRVGYGSQSTFSAAFARHVGQTPTSYARASLAA